jgi:hypothetical protein
MKKMREEREIKRSKKKKEEMDNEKVDKYE